jgi:hypothetical protein
MAMALSLPWEEEAASLPPEQTTTYRERSLNHQAPLTIEHPPVYEARGRAAIAGFCHEGGIVRRRTADGWVTVRQREVCDNVAPRTLWPGQTDPRPAWPERAYRRAVINSRG